MTPADDDRMTVAKTAVRAGGPGGGGSYQLRLAATSAEVQAALRLRDLVFPIQPGMSVDQRSVEIDDFGQRCAHLIVWHTPGAGEQRTVVATDRVALPMANRGLPSGRGLSADHGFDLGPLEPILGTTVEAGRPCIAPDHRGAATVGLLWAGIARYMLKAGCRYLVACASIPVSSGSGQAALLYDIARARFWAASRYQCRPRRQLVVDGVPRPDRLRIPPLLHEYLQLGATFCGPPAFDDVLGLADFLILLDLQHADPAYLRQLLQEGNL